MRLCKLSDAADAAQQLLATNEEASRDHRVKKTLFLRSTADPHRAHFFSFSLVNAAAQLETRFFCCKERFACKEPRACELPREARSRKGKGPPLLGDPAHVQ